MITERSAARLTGYRRIPRRPSPAPAALRREVVAGTYAPRDSAVRRTLASTDALAVLIGLVAVVALFGYGSPGTRILWGLPTIPLWLAVFRAYGMYDRVIKRISHTVIDDIPSLFHALVIGCLLVWLYYHLAPTPGIGFGHLIVLGGITAIGVSGLRSVALRPLFNRLGPERVLLIGDGLAMEALARKMRSHPEYGVEPVGIVTHAQRSANNGWPVELSFANLDIKRLVREHGVERVVIAHADIEEAELLELMRRCKQASLKVSVLPQLCDAMGPAVQIDNVEGITLLAVNPPVLSRSSMLLKRSMDLFCGGLMLLSTAPLMLLIAIAVKLDSPGPVLFRQTRMGRGGAPFPLLKFRTMVVDAAAMTEALMRESRDPHWLHLDHDPRVTRVGQWLRRSSLDELPQLWNVLRGEMSLVGPRPLVESEASQLIGWSRSRVDLMPGLTGLWQVLGRTNIPFEEMIKLDYLYVTNWTLWTDFCLMLRTLTIVFTQRGAN